MNQRFHYDHTRLLTAQRVAKAAVESEESPCIVLAVSSGDRPVWTTVVPGQDGVTETSIFPLASLTKAFIATALMQLVEQGLLLLSDPVANFLPAFRQHGKEHVTPWHLLTHTSGLIESDEQLAHLFAQRASFESYLELACNSSLAFTPGSQAHYSSHLAFIVLGALITAVTGQPYAAYVQTHLFTPLALHDTNFAPSDPSRAAPVHNYGPPEYVAYLNSLAAPSAGLWSTAHDLVTFGRAFLQTGRSNSQQILSPATVATMTRLHTQGIAEWVDGKPTSVYTALGWGIRHPYGGTLASERAFGQAGSTGCLLWIDPARDAVFVCLSNRWGANGTVALRALNAVYGAITLAEESRT